MEMKKYETPEMEVVIMKVQKALLDMSDPSAGNPGDPEPLP